MLTLILALSPIFLLLLLLLIWRQPLSVTAPICFVYAVGIAVFIWKMDPSFLGAALIRSGLISFEVFIIISGAVFFLEYLKQTGVIQSIEQSLSALSPDRRVQAILIAWLFGGFIEGTAGFGTPAAIVAPLLVALGFPVLTAILVALTANSTAVTFGAVGTPVLIGFSGLDISGVTTQAAILSSISALIIPPIIAVIVIRAAGVWRWKAFVEIMPWSLWATFAFLAPYVLFSFLGPEFPSLAGGILGLLLVTVSLKWQFLVPKQIVTFSESEQPATTRARPDFKAFLPYGLLALILVIGKLTLKDAQWLIPILPDLRYAAGAFNPGFAFFTTVVFIHLGRRASLRTLRVAAINSFTRLIKPLIALLFVTAMVQVLLLSRHNFSESPGMLDLFASQLPASYLHYLAPLLGAFGTFIAGSATVSNLVFGEVYVAATSVLDSDVSLILALQLCGAAAGNMIALPNILAVEATTGIVDREMDILSKVWLPCALYLGILTITALLA